MENVTLTQKEQARLQVLNSLLAEHVTLDQAATLMGVTPRHTRRILAAYREKGAAAVAHGHRGRRPDNATSEAVTAEYRFRALATVAALINSTSAISRSPSPSSALSSASARLTVRTDGLPRWETSLRQVRSDWVSLTLYLMAAMAGHFLAERSYPSMAAFSYSYKSIWERY